MKMPQTVKLVSITCCFQPCPALTALGGEADLFLASSGSQLILQTGVCSPLCVPPAWDLTPHASLAVW